eukprot:COSAG02_NODE_6708_length_3407_cov_3.645103_9_plen_86_part_00
MEVQYQTHQVDVGSGELCLQSLDAQRCSRTIQKVSVEGSFELPGHNASLRALPTRRSRCQPRAPRAVRVPAAARLLGAKRGLHVH